MPAPLFKPEEVARIRLNLERWSPAQWAAVFGCGKETISRILRHETYVGIGDNPNIPQSIPQIDPMQASARRAMMMAGVQPQAHPLAEEPDAQATNRAFERLASEAGVPADQALEEFMRQRGGTGE